MPLIACLPQIRGTDPAKLSDFLEDIRLWTGALLYMPVDWHSAMLLWTGTLLYPVNCAAQYACLLNICADHRSCRALSVGLYLPNCPRLAKGDYANCHSVSLQCSHSLLCALSASSVLSQPALCSLSLLCALTASSVLSQPALCSLSLLCALTASSVLSQPALCSHSLPALCSSGHLLCSAPLPQPHLLLAVLPQCPPLSAVMQALNFNRSVSDTLVLSGLCMRFCGTL